MIERLNSEKLLAPEKNYINPWIFSWIIPLIVRYISLDY